MTIPLVTYDDTHTRIEQLDRWGKVTSSTQSAAVGRQMLRVIRREMEIRLAARRPRMTQRAGVPDVYLFQREDSMQAHLQTLRGHRVRVMGVLSPQSRQGRYGVEPARPVPCVVTTWRV